MDSIAVAGPLLPGRQTASAAVDLFLGKALPGFIGIAPLCAARPAAFRQRGHRAFGPSNVVCAGLSMALQTITLSIDPALSCTPARTPDSGTMCAFCSVATGRWARHGCLPPGSQTSAAACALCSLPRHLERPRIDEEAALVWLPEISQAALNVTMREIHIALQALGEDVHADAVFRKRAAALTNLYHARAVLMDRRAAAEARVGTASPRELGLALLELSPAAYTRRGALLDGLRLLPLGRFFEHDTDVYPEIVSYWRDCATPRSTSPHGPL